MSLEQLGARPDRPCVAIVVGTRPELIKLAGTIVELRKSDAVRLLVVFTGQHAELVTDAAPALDVKPDLSIPPLAAGRSLADLLANIVGDLGRMLVADGVSAVVVQGDTLSALAGALVSELLAIPLIHLEAGVRSRLRDDPFPEETIRRIISPITELHLCFSEAGQANLMAEGISSDLIHVVPHPLRERVEFRNPSVEVGPERFVLMTLHRRERRAERAELAAKLIVALKEHRPSLLPRFVWHPSLDGDLAHFRPRLRDLGVEICAPLAPDDFLEHVARAQLVITDSAGVTEESQFLGRPLLILRASNEHRIDTVSWAPTCATEELEMATRFLLDVTGNAAASFNATTATTRASSEIARHIEEYVSGAS